MGCWSGLLFASAKVKVSHLCPTLCNPMGYRVHGILQARMLEWVAFPFSRGSSLPRDRTEVSCIAGGFFTSWTTREAMDEMWHHRLRPEGRCRQCSWEMLSRYKGNGIKYNKRHVSCKVRSCCQAEEGSKASVVKFSAVSREDKNLNFQVNSPCVRSVLNWQSYDPLSKVKGWEGAPSFPLTLMCQKISIVSA